MNIVEQSIWQIALKTPDKTAVRSGKSEATYQQLCRRILAARDFLTEKLSHGGTVILAAGKQIEFLYAYFGAHLAGLKVAPIAPDTNPQRFHHIVNETGSRLLIGFEDDEDQIPCIPIKEFANLPEHEFEMPEFPLDDAVADILFTTGTTGMPKGVPLTFKNEAAAARNINEYIGNSSDDVELLALPLSHSFGLGRVRCCLAMGSTIIVLGSFANVKKLYHTMNEFQVTGFTMVPASWRYLNKVSGDKIQEYADQLRYIEMGSAFFSAEEKRHLADILPNTRVCMHYGLTEASRSTFMEFHDDQEKLSSVGKPSPYTEIKIFDEQGNVLPPNTEGELCVKGEHVMKGYLHLNNSEYYFGEYFRTGDWGYTDDQGYVFLKGRQQELINVGGKKVVPIEVEAVLMNIDGIADCACAGIPDPDGILGDVVKAFIVREPDSDLTFESIANQIHNKLEYYKLPVEYQWVEEIPKTQNGKIQRFLLR